MKNLIWIALGVAAGYYLAKKSPGLTAPATSAPASNLPQGSAIPNAGLAPNPGVGYCQGDFPTGRYLNCNSLWEAKHGTL